MTTGDCWCSEVCYRDYGDGFCERNEARAGSVLFLEEHADADFIADWLSGDHGGLESSI